jgi:hypothetical protein
MEGFPESRLVESGQGAPRTGSSNNGGREINVDSFSIRLVLLLWIFCDKRIVSLHNRWLIRYWSHSAVTPTRFHKIGWYCSQKFTITLCQFSMPYCHTAKIASEEIAVWNAKWCRVYRIRQVWQSEISICFVSGKRSCRASMLVMTRNWKGKFWQFSRVFHQTNW